MSFNEDFLDLIDDKEPVSDIEKALIASEQQGGLTIPFATLPSNMYIKGAKYKVSFDRILTPRFTKDVDELRTCTSQKDVPEEEKISDIERALLASEGIFPSPFDATDIRSLLSDNAIKDMLAEEDARFLATARALTGKP